MEMNTLFSSHILTRYCIFSTFHIFNIHPKGCKSNNSPWLTLNPRKGKTKLDIFNHLNTFSWSGASPQRVNLLAFMVWVDFFHKRKVSHDEGFWVSFLCYFCGVFPAVKVILQSLCQAAPLLGLMTSSVNVPKLNTYIHHHSVSQLKKSRFEFVGCYFIEN